MKLEIDGSGKSKSRFVINIFIILFMCNLADVYKKNTWDLLAVDDFL